jgi:hypothetical protein
MERQQLQQMAAQRALSGDEPLILCDGCGIHS